MCDIIDKHNLDDYYIDNYYIEHCNYIIKNLLLSLDNHIIYDIINPNNKIIKCIFKYNLGIFINLLKSMINSYYNINTYNPYNTLNIIIIKYKNKIIQTIYLYKISISNYTLKFTECFFDCNLILLKYNGDFIIKNLHNNVYLNLNNIINRKYYKKFCYLSNDFDNYFNYDLIIDNTNLIIDKSNIINKLLYSKKLINLGWIMDEYVLKENSWTLNYWLNYKQYLNIIKFNNNNTITNDICDICNHTFLDNNIVFNNKNKYTHFNCIFSEILNKT
jgi:hypothetical protein